MSYGFFTYSSEEEAAVEYAFNHGVALVAAAGNSGDGVDYPAKLSEVIAVVASDENNTIADYDKWWSNSVQRLK